MNRDDQYLMMWTDQGVWLQRRDREGRLWVSDMGRMKCKGLAQAWCAQHGVPFRDETVQGSRRRAAA